MESPPFGKKFHSVLYLQLQILDASPKAISGRTSYYQARLVFRFLPQLIPGYCTVHGFGPPSDFRQSSPWPWQARLASGPPPLSLLENPRNALLILDFSVPPDQRSLDKESGGTRWFVLQKVRGRPLLQRRGFPLFVSEMVSGSISPGSPPYFSPFPHGTGSLSVRLSI